jgi:uncharacterized damage-inducible protein DinB
MKSDTTLARWSSISSRIREAVAGLSEADLDLRGGSEGWSIRESVHHLVEANLVVSNIVVAAVGKPGVIYDWSWVTPDASWMIRLGYDRASIEPAIQLLEALSRHIVSVLQAAPDSMRQRVKLLDEAGAKPRSTTVRKILADEAVHAAHHLKDVAAARRRTKRSLSQTVKQPQWG